MKRTSILFLTMALISCTLVGCSDSNTKNENVIYVDSNATQGDGTSWDLALDSIDTALEIATSGDEIWIKEGLYSPAESTGFTMKDNVDVYGGFSGTESALSERSWEDNVTTLSGENEATHVVIAANSILDGFTITEGGTPPPEGGPPDRKSVV